MLGKIIKIEEIFNLETANVGRLTGSNGSSLGMSQLIHAMAGCGEYDGYLVETDEHKYHVLISNTQDCCESWGYFSSEDDVAQFVGARLKEVNLTDVALNKKKIEDSGYYEEEGGIQFVDFVTDRGTLQLAVYNAHNGYYGHGIIVAKDAEILLGDTL